MKSTLLSDTGEKTYALMLGKGDKVLAEPSVFGEKHHLRSSHFLHRRPRPFVALPAAVEKRSAAGTCFSARGARQPTRAGLITVKTSRTETKHSRTAITGQPIAVEGRTCWRRAHADQVAFLVDGDAYFTALAHAIRRAQRSVFILGWNIDSRVRLIANPRLTDRPVRLAPLIKRMLSRRPDLHV